MNLNRDSITYKINGTGPLFSPNNAVIANYAGSNIYIYDAQNSTLIKNLFISKSKFNFCFSPNSKYLATASSNNSLQIFDLNDFSLKYTYAYRSSGAFGNVTASNDGKYLAVQNGYLLLLKAFWNTTNAEESTTKQTFEISPNPTDDFIEITVRANGRSPLQSDIKIFNIYGQTVLSVGVIHELPLRIDVSGLALGMYFVRIGEKVTKFVKM